MNLNFSQFYIIQIHSVSLQELASGNRIFHVKMLEF